MSKINDLKGKVFGRLHVIRFLSISKRNAYWYCFCSCGKTCIKQGTRLTAGKTTSCGCRQEELRRNGSIGRKHGMYGTSEYSTYRNMLTRCYNNKSKSYKHYGGRGIKVCRRWRNSFENFYADMGDKPGAGYSIERIDNNKGYSPDNCKWATKKEQAQNKRSVVKISVNGETHTIPEWAKIIGADYRLIHARIYKLGWSKEKAVSTPPR